MQEADLAKQPEVSRDVFAAKQEVARLNAALKRATEERNIFKKTAAYFHSE